MPPLNTAGPDGRRLDLLVLGPMGDEGNEPSLLCIKDALDSLLKETAFQTLLASHQIDVANIHVPIGQNESEIVNNIFGLLDTADLVILDITPKPSDPDRANVFYELALVHALGIPAMLLIQSGQSVPFYAQSTNQYRVSNFEPATLVGALRAPLLEFLDFANRRTTFANNRVTQFYGLPIVDISAAVGLATGYYYNFISRLITEGGFISHYPQFIKQVLYVRPSSIHSTYEADIAMLKTALAREGYELKLQKLDKIDSDDKGPLWFDHVNGIVLDIPRTIYPLRRSPRLLSFHQRHQSFPSPGAEKSFLQRTHQIEENLLSRVTEAIRFQIRHDGPRVRAGILHFTTIADAAALVKQLSS